MDKALYISMTAGQQSMDAMALRSNNLANVNTTGFGADFAQARAMGVYYSGTLPSRAYAVTESPGTNLEKGALIETGRELDVAVDGEGWLVVQAPDGTEAFTRAGSLKIDAFGQLLTGNNLPVLGGGGPIAIPPADKVTIGADGTITILPQGQEVSVLATVDRIRMVNPEADQLYKGADGLIRRRDGEEQPVDASLSLQSGFLESSNVNAVEEFTHIMSLSRQFEMNVKMMSTLQENASSANRILQFS